MDKTQLFDILKIMKHMHQDFTEMKDKCFLGNTIESIISMSVFNTNSSQLTICRNI